MSFSRIRFDDDNYKYSLKQSIAPGVYQFESILPCYPCFPIDRPTQRVGPGCTNKNLTDIDSDLQGISNPASDCPTDLYKPNKDTFCESELYPICDILTPEDTRLTNGPCTLRGTGWNRFEAWLCANPQDNVLMPFDTNINNRLITKDNHRPLIPNPIFCDAIMPPRENNCIEYDWSSRYNIAQNEIPDVQLATCQNIKKL